MPRCAAARASSASCRALGPAPLRAGHAGGELRPVRLAGGERLEPVHQVAGAAVAYGRVAIGRQDGDGRGSRPAEEGDEAVPEERVDRLHRRVLELGAAAASLRTGAEVADGRSSFPAWHRRPYRRWSP